METSIAALRKEYATSQLSESELLPNPIQQFEKWWNEALTSAIEEPNAMTLATASSDGLPSARIVLLKGFDENGFIFFTNYKSFKGNQLEENPKACLVFFWKELERQVRVTGFVQKTSNKESDTYFKSRPPGSQLGAIISPQSQVIDNRDWLENNYSKLEKEAAQHDLQRPSHWGGYCVKPVIIEFWQGRKSRLHDRIQYTLDEKATWKIERLAP